MRIVSVWMRALGLSVAFGAACVFAGDDDLSTRVAGRKVFYTGHSFHAFVEQGLEKLAQEGGLKRHQSLGRSMIGDSAVVDHWNLPTEKNAARKKLAEGEVEVLTLSPHRLVPDEGIALFAREAISRNPDVRIYIQISWPDFPVATLQARGTGGERMAKIYIHVLRAQAEKLNRQQGKNFVHLVPVGQAFLALIDKIRAGEAPGITSLESLFKDDKGHASPLLEALAIYCWYAAVYQRNPQGLTALIPVEGRSDPEQQRVHRFLQGLAWQAVMQEPLNGLPPTQ